ncbi:hypothetical protein IFM89_035848 [Coptis chinensis]|uniref:Uncharacterized protein n=1 Tax=Coptis chinensis TaxID=261450 RepID=A0A835HSF1_9MAGN|nr:hypothetical protein IFM89_035848 [Coptis chinensis]
MRVVGKNSRKALKLLHTSGRRGATSTIHNLKKKNPNIKITRTHSYMAIHTHKDGSFLAPERMARINVIIENDPSSIDLDLDNDPVAQVRGPDQYGHVLGMGVGVSKTSLIALGPAKEKLHQETQQRTMVEEWVGTIEKHMIMLTQILMEIKDQCTKSIVADTSTSSVREPANTQSHGNYSHGMQLCELLNMHREVVAKGRATKALMFLLI